MRKTLAIAAILPALALFAGCNGQGEPSTPVACQDGAETWATALREAPDVVRLDGSTPISDCLPADQPAGQQETVGLTAVRLATARTRTARLADSREPGPAVHRGIQAALEAGYLLGALERGSAESQGIHATLIDRVRSAATNGLDAEPEGLQAAFEEGLAAGLETG